MIRTRLINSPTNLLLALSFLDSLSLGTTVPVLPLLLKSMSSSWVLILGVISSGYATLQILFAPTLGRLGDRFGPKPVLIIAALAESIASIVCITTSSVATLLAVRITAGAFAANATIWNACTAQAAQKYEYTALYSHRSSAFVLGAIMGTALGSVLSQRSLHLPFIVGACLTLATAVLLTYLGDNLDCRRIDTGGPQPPHLKRFSYDSVHYLLIVHFAVQIVSQIGLVMWVINGQERYNWSSSTSGLSLCVYGLLNVIVQIVLTPILTARMQPWRLIFIFLAVDAVAHILVGFASKGWMFFSLLPLLALPAPAIPTLQALLSSNVDKAHQCKFQARVTQLTGSAAIVTPFAATTIHTATHNIFPGLVWILAAIVYVVATPFFIISWKRDKDKKYKPNF